MKYASLFAFVALLLTVGCATKPQTSFYLLPDSQVHVGEVEVTNPTDSATLTQANETVAASSEDKPFSESREASSEEIATKFGDALGVELEPMFDGVKPVLTINH